MERNAGHGNGQLKVLRNRLRFMISAIALTILVFAAVFAIAEPVPGDTSPVVNVEVGEEDDLAEAFDRGLPLALALIFLVGLALNLTPCVYPMMAVTVSLFGGRSEGRGLLIFGRALSYVLGIATMYSVLGVAAALTGGLFGGLMQSRTVLVFISLLFVALALSMFGLYELRLPSGIMARLGNKQGAGVAGLFISGLLVGVFAAPCIGPPMIALLAFVGQRGDPFFGFMVFFVLSLGLGLPYLVLGTFSGLIRKMPSSGEWLNWVKRLLGFVLLGVAFLYLALALRPSLIVILIPATAVVGGLYLGLIEKSRTSGPWFVWIKRCVGMAAVIAGIVFFLAGRKPTLEWTPYSAELLAASQRPAVIYFTADWCVYCVEMELRTFTDEELIRELNRFALFKVDLTRPDEPGLRELLEYFEVRGVPTMLFINTRGEEIRAARKSGFVSAANILRTIEDLRVERKLDPQ